MTPVFTTVLIIALVISVSLTSLIVGHLHKERKAKSLLADFYEVAEQFRLLISKNEVMGNRIIGLDRINNSLLFFSKINDRSDGYLVDLSKVKASTVNREYELNKSYDTYRANMQPILRKIVLQLEYKSGGKPLRLAFYEKATDPIDVIGGRASKAIEWQALLASRLRLSGDPSKTSKRAVIANDILC